MRLQSLVVILVGLAGVGLLVLSLGNIVPFSPVKFVVVRSNSMRPVLTTGDIAVIKTSWFKPQTGQVVLYQKNNQLRLHRLVKQSRPGQWITKGDANPTADKGLLKSEQIKGLLIGKIPVLGYLITLKVYLNFIIFVWTGWVIASLGFLIFNDRVKQN